MEKWYLFIDGQQIGPIAEDQILNFNPTPDSLVWREGMTEWLPLRNFPNLMAIITTPPQNPYQQPQQPPYQQQQQYPYQQPQPQPQHQNPYTSGLYESESGENKNLTILWCVIGALMFIFVGFCDVISLGSKSASGFDLITESLPWGLISDDVKAVVMAIKLLLLLMLAVPAWLVIVAATKGQDLDPSRPFKLCVTCCVLGLISVIAKMLIVGSMDLPADPFSIGFGIYLYILTGVVGAVIAKKSNNTIEQ